MAIISLPVVLIWIPVEIETRILNLFSFLIKPKNAQKPVDRLRQSRSIELWYSSVNSFLRHRKINYSRSDRVSRLNFRIHYLLLPLALFKNRYLLWPTYENRISKKNPEENGLFLIESLHAALGFLLNGCRWTTKNRRRHAMQIFLE